jgi:gluconolactonase
MARDIKIWDVAGAELRHRKRVAQQDVAGAPPPGPPDRDSCDADGNLWCGARPGVQVLAPNGDRIGMIRLPEICANVCFGGAKRNRLFMAASQSLYAAYVGVRGA